MWPPVLFPCLDDSAFALLLSVGLMDRCEEKREIAYIAFLHCMSGQMKEERERERDDYSNHQISMSCCVWLAGEEVGG